MKNRLLSTEISNPLGAGTTWSPGLRRLVGLVSVALFLAVWEILPALGWVDVFFVSSPSRILAVYGGLSGSDILHNTLITLNELLLGFCTATIAGVGIGLMMGWFGLLDALLDPFVEALNATPRVVLLPVLLLWLGIGLASKVAVVFLGVLFPVILNTTAGVKHLEASLVNCSRSFGASNRQIFLTIALPGSLPWIVTGMRQGLGRGMVGVVVAEMAAANAGLGHMISVAGSTFQTNRLFAGVLLLVGLGYGLSLILRSFENRLQNWKTTQV